MQNNGTFHTQQNANANANGNGNGNVQTYQAPVANLAPGPLLRAPATPPRALTLQEALHRANEDGRRRRRAEDDEEDQEPRPPKRLRVQNETPVGSAFNHWGMADADLFPRADYPPRVEYVTPQAPTHHVSPEDLEAVPYLNQQIGHQKVAQHQLSLTNLVNASLNRGSAVTLANHRVRMNDLVRVGLNPEWWVKMETQMRAWGWAPKEEEVNEAGWLLEEIMRGREDDEVQDWEIED